jgi:hypothetical protein
MRLYFYISLVLVAVAAAAILQLPRSQAQELPASRSASGPLTDPVRYYRADPSDKGAGKLVQADYELSRKSEQLAAQYGAAKEDDKKSQLRTQLREALEKQFELQEQRRQEELAQIEARLKSLRELMQKRKDARQTIIDRRLDQLLRDAEGLGWNAPSSGGSSSRVPNAAAYFTPQTLPTPARSR